MIASHVSTGFDVLFLPATGRTESGDPFVNKINISASKGPSSTDVGIYDISSVTAADLNTSVTCSAGSDKRSFKLLDVRKLT